MAAALFSVLLCLRLLVGSLEPPEHAEITLNVEGGGKKETAFVDQTPPESGKNPRPVLTVRRSDLIAIDYMLTNVYPHKTLEDMVVHFYVARIDQVGQKELPRLEEGLVVETAFDIDMKPGARAGSRLRTRIQEAGVYLVRIETKLTQSDHEHFAAIDLVVKD